MERLDALASVYSVASAVSDVAYPIRFRWYRTAPMDAAMTLPDGRTVGIVRQGLTADRSGFSRRLWRLRDWPMPGAVLVLMTDGVRLRHARRMLSTTEVPALFALEREAVLAGAGDPIWRPPNVAAAVEGPAWDIPDHMLPVLLKPAEKRALDLISDWPWIALKELAGLMGVSPQRASQIVIPLEGFGLAARPRDAGGRLALTDRGLSLLARRDRTSVGVAKGRWSITLLDAEAHAEWRNVSGGRSRQLLRNIEHTAAVHGFLAAMTAQAPLLGWEVAQFDPPRRASRHFRHDDQMRAVNPDAFGVLRKADTTWPFFLEWERRAVRPSTMSARLAPYLRYYSSHRPTDDHGTRPSVLIVFDDEIAHTHFLRVAREETHESRVDVPLWVSHREAVDALGPLGRAWRTPGDGESPRPCRNNQRPTGGSASLCAAPLPIGERNAMRSQNTDKEKGPRRRGGRSVVRLDAAALWTRLALLNRSQNWLAREIGVSPSYVSMLVNGERSPSGSIRRRMLKALGVDDFKDLFTMEDRDEQD